MNLFVLMLAAAAPAPKRDLEGDDDDPSAPPAHTHAPLPDRHPGARLAAPAPDRYTLRVGLKLSLTRCTLFVRGFDAGTVHVLVTQGGTKKRLSVPRDEFDALLDRLRTEAQGARLPPSEDDTP